MSVFETTSLPIDDSQRRLKLQCEQNILMWIQQIEGYLYESNGSNKNRAEFRCKQRLKGKSCTFDERPSQMKVVDRMRQFNCVGAVYISNNSNKAVITITHESHQEVALKTVKLNEAEMSRVGTLYQQGMDPHQI